MPQNHVLVADHDGDLAANITAMLEAMPGRQIRCAVAGTASRAREIARERTTEIDLLIVEQRLPDSDGLTLVAGLRALCPDAESIIVTADAELDDAVEALGHRVFAYLRKPFAPSALLQAADAALARVELMREREQLRRELEISESRHRAVVEALPAFVLACDHQGQILLWNNRLEEVTGQRRGQMLGKNVRELIGEGGDRRLFSKDGSVRLVRWQLKDVRDADGQCLTYALGTDVTDERAMLRRTLRAERLAAVGTLATGLAHEVRNPLNSATLQLHVLRRRLERAESSDPSLLPIVETVDGEIKRLDRLVNDFLAFARPHPLRLESASLSQLLASIADEVRPEAGTLGVTVRVESDSGVERVEADVERLRQVLLNLTRNAIEAMPGGGALTLRLHRADPEGFVALQIEDTGIGIAEDAPIFDAFFTTKQSGTGLGLAIVHRIIEEHGGSVQYESKPGSTRFTIKLLASSELGAGA